MSYNKESLVRLRHLETAVQHIKALFAEMTALEELREEVFGENGAAPALETAISDLDNSIFGTDGAVEALNKRIDEEIFGENGAVMSLDTAVTALRDEVFGINNEPGALAELEAALREEMLGENGEVTKANAEIERLRSDMFGEGGTEQGLNTAISELETGLSETIEERATELWNELNPLIEAFQPGVVALYHLEGDTAPPPGWVWYETDEQGAPLPVSESRPGLVYIIRGA